MKTYTKPAVEITKIENESVISLSGIGIMGSTGKPS